LACDGACGGETPVCDAGANVCVQCVGNDDCDGATPACDVETNTCVECVGSDDCDGAQPLCDADANTCVECLESDDCDDAAAARCDGGQCVPCIASDDCEHLVGTAVCSVADGLCVECTVNDETPCGDNSCDPAALECTETARGSVATCRACVADSECAGGNQEDPDARCVPMQFQSVPREGGFCFRREAKGCMPPYAVLFDAISLSGADEEGYCAINQDLTRCEAVLDLIAGTPCPDGEDATCGGGEGGLCRTVGGVANQCTYPCGGSLQCITGTTCIDQPYCH
jgi:hypothetical protein